MKLRFLGAAQTVTGSKYLIESGDTKILIDCGLYQGYKELRLRNWDKLPIDPKSIDAVLLTHAHIDHSGYLPLLVKHGFRGPIYASKATRDLCKILLPDSAHIHEEDARRANKYGYSKHHPALPLYTIEDANIALQQFTPVEYSRPYNIVPEVHASWHRAGHILGASSIKLNVEGTELLFTGDMGRLKDPIMRPPAIMQSTDYLIIESTYGDRLHSKSDPKDALAEVINKTVKRGGTTLIASFAVGRAQNLLYYLAQLKAENRIPNIPIYLDSPMAINATKILCRHPKEHKLTAKQCDTACNIATYINTPDESKAIDNNPDNPSIIISASGMMTGGRILHHLNVFARDPRNTILITGFQAPGTRGARILNGEKEIKMLGTMVPIHAQVEYLSNTSAHADYEELLTWLRHFNRAPQHVFITHGELEAAEGLKKQIETQLKWSCSIPDYLSEEIL